MPGRNFSSPSYRYGYNGKEKVDEIKGLSGADYDFSARMYDARLGRFLSVDPLANQMSHMSTYTFALDNPISVIDGDGKWPTWIHNRIINMAFKGILTSNEIKVLQRASLHTDSKPGSQNPDHSSEHFMSAPNQSKEEARIQSETFIRKKGEEASTLKGDEALFALGEGMHTIMDGTSPSHHGSQVWEGVNKNPATWFKGLGHLIRELNPLRINDKKVKEASKAIRDYYLQETQVPTVDHEAQQRQSSPSQTQPAQAPPAQEQPAQEQQQQKSIKIKKPKG